MDITEIKKQEVIKELGEWFGKPNCKSFYYDEPLKTIQNGLREPKLKKSISLGFEELELWHNNSFVYYGLTDHNVVNRAPSATYSYFVLELSSILAESFPGNPPRLSFHKVANYLANVIIQKWGNEAENMLEWIMKGLDTKFLRGGQNFNVAAWFITSLACKAFNKKLATEKYHYPSDMGVYQPVLDRWDTQDANEVDKMVSELCDYHLAQATYGDGKNMADIQFSFTAEFVYVYEILAWLSLREMNGLRNPEAYAHPLMRLFINRLPEAITQYQPTDLYERVLSRMKEEFKA
jgi:hypothetical protein